MITYTSNKGRLGNRLFQITSLMGLAERHGHDFRLPKWDLEDCFEWDIPEYKNEKIDEVISEPHFHYAPGFFEEHLKDQSKTIDVEGWLQSEKYFGSRRLRFRPAFIQSVLQKINRPVLASPIAIAVRRGDMATNPGYYHLPITYFILALFEHFPDWQSRDLLIFSDDPDYVKLHFGCLANAHFPALTAIEDLCLGAQCSDHIISNSTFSWWMAYLNENPGKKVIRPARNFDGEHRKKHSEADFWPEEWTVFEHEGKKIDLRDTTFTIPVHYDHPDRKGNLDLSVSMLLRDFDTNIVVGEEGGSRFNYMKSSMQYRKFAGFDSFHRTRMLNDMARQAQTPIVVNYDADIFLPPLQLFLTAEAIRKGADMVYPYDGRFAQVPRAPYFKKLKQTLDAGVFAGPFFKGLDRYRSVGGCVAFNRTSFLEGGGENEFMIAYGAEDVERFERFNRLGYRVERIDGPLFHLDHFRSVNSSKKNPFYKDNSRELEKVKAMNRDELRAYVSSWPWAGEKKMEDKNNTRISETLHASGTGV